MSDKLLTYYNSELAYVRELLKKEFVKNHPKMAARMGLGDLDREESSDPHVRRLIEAFAYLNARIRYKLEDDFPEISDSFLNVLYPHYLAPIPSFAIVQFIPDSTLSEIYNGLSQGTELETDPIDGQPYRFKTSYPVTLWPAQVKSVNLNELFLPASTVPQSKDAKTVIALQICCSNDKLTFSKLGTSNQFIDNNKIPLRFFLKGPEQYIYPLYEGICNTPLQVAIAESVSDNDPILLGPECLRPVGFSRTEGILPYPARSFMGYRLLTEYFAFPEKFLFVDIFLDKKHLSRFGRELEIYIYCSQDFSNLKNVIGTESFALGCTPIINLFRQPADQGLLDHTRYEYDVIPSMRHRNTMEIYSIDSVSASDEEGNTYQYLPFYGNKHILSDRNQRYWYASRCFSKHHSGTDMLMSLVDLNFKPSEPIHSTLHIQLTCSNHNLPSKIPFGDGQPYFQLRTVSAPLLNDKNKSGIKCITKPTPSLPVPGLNQNEIQNRVWRLISHLSLNHLSITDGEEGAKSLQEILSLYDYKNSNQTLSQIQAIHWVECSQGTCRIPICGKNGVSQGTIILIGIDQKSFEGKSLLLFVQILDHFFALYCAINSFTQLKVYDKSDLGKKELLYKCQPRSGEKQLL